MAKTVDPVIKRLRDYIEQGEQSQNQLAVKAGLTPQRLSNLLNNRGQIKPAEIKALCGVLEIPVSELFE